MGEDIRCVCGIPSPRLYDERTELYFCDVGCFNDHFAEQHEDYSKWYRRLNVYEIDAE